MGTKKIQEKQGKFLLKLVFGFRNGIFKTLPVNLRKPNFFPLAEKKMWQLTCRGFAGKTAAFAAVQFPLHETKL